MKNVLASKTIRGIILAAVGAGGLPGQVVPAEYAELADALVQIIGLLLAAWGRWKAGGLTTSIGKAPSPPASLFVLAALTIAGCGSCPPGTRENADNVAAIVGQNAGYSARSDAPAGVKAADKLRNDAALVLAEKLAAECESR